MAGLVQPETLAVLCAHFLFSPHLSVKHRNTTESQIYEFEIYVVPLYFSSSPCWGRRQSPSIFLTLTPLFLYFCLTGVTAWQANFSAVLTTTTTVQLWLAESWQYVSDCLSLLALSGSMCPCSPLWVLAAREAWVLPRWDQQNLHVLSGVWHWPGIEGIGGCAGSSTSAALWLHQRLSLQGLCGALCFILSLCQIN